MVYSPKPRSDVFCFKLNFKISTSGYLELNKKNPRKTWELINELSSRKCGKTRNISEIRIYDKTIKSRVFWSLKAPNIITVCKLLSDINERKATGLDRIPCKLLKLAGDIAGPLLTSIFKSSVAKVTSIFKRVLNPTLTITYQYLYYPLSQKFSKKLFTNNFMIT